jgi:putative hydrolase of HD superfamily
MDASKAPPADARGILAFVSNAGTLKNLQRSGWRMRGIREAESIADHAYRVTLLAMVLADTLAERGQPLDTERVLRLAQLHEIAEAKLGDIPQPASRYLPTEVKEEAERRAVSEMASSLGALGRRYETLWREFEEARTREARLVRAADKLEMLIQVSEYEHTGYRSLGDFWERQSNRPYFEEFPLVLEIAELLYPGYREE